ncbi:uncharacterized protein ISCGN_029914 [Ixodes scapularis]|uniref:Putative secreted protein n=1 Tax=Ixodes scapularis TaxID=6945 RepID=A0A4D5RKY0_IXOSC
MESWRAAAFLLWIVARTARCQKNTGIYNRILLNDYCGNAREAKKELRSSAASLSSAIVTAVQRRRRSPGSELCEYEVQTTGGTGLIVAISELNLRMGTLNTSCIDYICIKTKYTLSGENDVFCGKVTSDLNKHWTTSYSIDIEFFSKTPISYFVKGDIVKIIVTSFTEASDGGCGPGEFRCASSRCIFGGYRCDDINNCGDGSDEALFGDSMCLMPKSSLILITLGVANLVITWFSVFYCCVRNALTKKKVLQEDRWGMATPPLLTAIAREGSQQDGSGGAFSSPDNEMTTGPLQVELTRGQDAVAALAADAQEDTTLSPE